MSQVRFGEMYKIVARPKSYAQIKTDWPKTHGGKAFGEGVKHPDFYKPDDIARAEKRTMDMENTLYAHQSANAFSQFGQMAEGYQGKPMRTPFSALGAFTQVAEAFCPPEQAAKDGEAPGFQAFFVTDGPTSDDAKLYQWATTYKTILDDAEKNKTFIPLNFNHQATKFIATFKEKLERDAIQLPVVFENTPIMR